MPSITKKVTNKVIEKDTEVIKEETVIENTNKVQAPIKETEDTYKMQVSVKDIEDDAYAVLAQINSHGITGFVINAFMDNGFKYEIIYGGKVTKAEAREIFNKIKHITDLQLMLIR